MNNLKPQTLRRLLNFEAHHDLNLELEKFLNNGGRVKVAAPSPKNFPTWMTVTRALHPTAEAYIEALEANGSTIEDGARKIVKAMNVSQQKTVVELVRVFGRDLGFLDIATMQEIHDHAVASGLDLLTPEDAVLVRLAYKNQPCGEHLGMAMKGIEVCVGYVRVLNVDRGYGRRLSTEDGDPDCQRAVSLEWVFSRRPKVA